MKMGEYNKGGNHLLVCENRLLCWRGKHDNINLLIKHAQKLNLLPEDLKNSEEEKEDRKDAIQTQKYYIYYWVETVDNQPKVFNSPCFTFEKWDEFYKEVAGLFWEIMKPPNMKGFTFIGENKVKREEGDSQAIDLCKERAKEHGLLTNDED